MAKVLIVDDDVPLSKTIEQWLELEHYVLETTNSGLAALELLGSFNFDIVILDWELPDLSGLEIIRKYRKMGGSAPVLMLTGNDAPSDKALGLDMGADDYLTKPFDFTELSARLRALLRRPAQVASSLLAVRDIVVDPVGHKVLKKGKPVTLRPIEFAFIEFLFRHPKEVFTSEQLLNSVWKSTDEVSSNALYTVIKRLREKLDEPGEESIIRTVHGHGYGLEAFDEPVV